MPAAKVPMPGQFRLLAVPKGSAGQDRGAVVYREMPRCRRTRGPAGCSLASIGQRPKVIPITDSDRLVESGNMLMVQLTRLCSTVTNCHDSKFAEFDPPASAVYMKVYLLFFVD
jgi:hypothetical protein